MNIYNKNGVQITNGVTADLPITPDCRLVQELMRGEYVEMSWEDTQRYPLPVGSYIIPFPSEVNPYIQNDSRYPVKYIIFEEYDPEGKSEAQFEFTPQFQHPIMWLSRVPFVLVTGDVSTWAKGLKKTTWGYTGNVVNVANYIVDCINWISSHNTKFGNAIGTGWTAIVDNNLTPSATVNFEAVDIWSAAGLIAQAFDCEFHFDYARKQFRLGAIRYGTTVTLKSGDNVSVANVSRNKEGFANAFLVKGSTRNLSQPTDTGENAQVRERLTLNPQTYPDSMIYTNDDGTIITKLQFEELNEPILIKELIFDGVYPKLELYLYDLRERECWLLNELGEKVPDATNPHGYKTYSKWYCRLAYPVYNSTGTITEWRDYLNPTIIDGQTLQMTFLPNHLGNAKTSLMIGQGDFDVVYFSEQTVEKEDDDINENGFTAYPGDYRIVFKDESGLIIPTTSRGGIYPQGYAQPDLRANIATLINIVVDNTYKAIAQQELEKVAIRKVQLDRANLNNYTFQSNPIAFEANNISLHIGQAVSYDDGQDLNGGVSTVLATHIVKIISQLDYPFVKEITVGNEKVKTSINTLQEKVETIIANLGSGNYLSESQLDLMIKNYGSRYFLSKTNDDTARGFIRMLKGFQVGERFVTGLLGEGGVFRKDADGTTYIEADKLYIRMKAYFDTVEVREYIHSGGNRVASPADCRVIRVEWIDSNGNVLEQTDANLSNAVKFRCYFRGSDGEKTITNDFVVGDQAYCHITNMESNDSLYQHHYWRLVIGKDAEVNENGEHYIDLSNANSNTISGVSYAGYQTGSDVPVPQDSIVQLGNVNDNTRRGAVVEFVSGADSPSYQIFQNIGTPVGSTITQKRNSQYSFADKNFIGIGYSTQTGRAYMNVFGDTYIGDPDGSTYIEYKQVGQGGVPELNIKANVMFTSPETHQDTTLEDFASAVVGDLESLQEQIDGSIESWFYDHVPTLQNTPASEWTTTDDKLRHLGDLFYNTTTGYGYRFANTGTQANPVFEWLRITDTDVVKALADAAKAQDTADHKRRVFVVQPTPPYDAGDLWVNATYPSGNTETDESQHKYYNDVLRCGTSKDDSGSFAIADWSLASKYTDDSALENFLLNTYAPDKLDLQQQIDGKAETWHQSTNPAAAWTTTDEKAAHVGDLWYCTVDISGTDFKKDTTWYYADKGANANPRYVWEKQDVPEEVFDKIDGKSSIYTNAVSSPPADYKKNDLWILPADATINNISYKQGDVLTTSSDSATYNPSHWSKKVRYTDDTEVRRIINSYGSILGVTADSKDVGEALGFLREVLGGKTSVDGGLILSELIAVKNGSQVMSGINGKIKASTGLLTPAAWYGGEMVDYERLSDTEIADGWNVHHWARALFRFDGSGYVADGNLAWNGAGEITKLAGQSFEASSLTILGYPAATQNWVSQNFVTVEYFDRLFRAYFGNNAVSPNAPSSTQIDSIEARYSLWTEGDLSCLGHGRGGGGGSTTALSDLVDVLLTSPTSGQALVYNGTKWVNQTISGGGGVDMSAVWSALNATTNEQINASHLTNALSGYATTSDLNGYLSISGGTLTGELITASPITINGYNGRTFGITPTSAGHNGDNVDVGWNWTDKDGAGAFFRSSDANSQPGSFGFYARNSSGTTCQLIGTPAGSLTWGGNELLTSADAGNFVTLDTAQTVTGAKTFSSTITLSNASASYTISAKDATSVSRNFLKIDYTMNSDTGVQTANMLLNSYGYLTTVFAPANTEGYQRLRLGSSNKLNAANNMYGSIRLYGRRDSSNPSGTVYYGDINPAVLSANRTWTLPNKSGTIALADDFGDLFTALTSTNATNLSVTIGGTTKTLDNLYALRFKGVQVTADTLSYGDLNSLTGTSYSIVTNYHLNSNWQHAPSFTGLSNYWGGAVVVKGQDSNLMMQLFWNAKHNESTTPTGKLWFRARTAGGWGDDWKEVVFADGNIATATALATARTLWGQSFDGTANVSGNMTGVGTIDATGNNTITHSGTTASRFIAINGVGQVELMVASANWGVYSRTNSSWIIGTNGTNTFMSIGNVGIGTTTPSYLLHVNGQAAAQTFRSTVETGTAPMVVASSTLVTNLNADLLDGKHSTDFASASDVTTLQGYFDANGNARNALRLTTVSKTAWGQTFWTANGVPTSISGNMSSVGSITCTNNSRISNATGSGGSLYIGRADDAGWVKMSDMCSRQGDSYWKIKSNGDAHFNGVFSLNDVSAQSDARKKTIIEHVTLDVRRIAKMPIVRFLWKDRSDNSLQVGTLAQSWLPLLPEIVTHSNDDVYGVKYGVGAMCIGISNSREIVGILNEIAAILNKVKSHDERLTLLERENRELREEIDRIKAA